jgi:hypothetical protein
LQILGCGCCPRIKEITCRASMFANHFHSITVTASRTRIQGSERLKWLLVRSLPDSLACIDATKTRPASILEAVFSSARPPLRIVVMFGWEPVSMPYRSWFDWNWWAITKTNSHRSRLSSLSRWQF